MVRTPVQTNYMCDCPNHLHIDVVGTAAPPPGASASDIHHASTFRCTPLAWFIVTLAWRLPPSLVAALPGAASRRTPFVRLACRIVRRLGLSYGWPLCCHCHVTASCASTPLDRDSARLRLPTASAPSTASVPCNVFFPRVWPRGGSESEWMI